MPNGPPTLGANPSVTPTIDATPSVTPTLDVTLTATPTEAPLGTPGPNALVYQGFWSGEAHGELRSSDWFGNRSWTTSLGMLVSDGAPATSPAFAQPMLPGGLPQVASARSYAVEAQFGLTGTHEHSGFGVYVRGTAMGPPPPAEPGRWRAGLAEGHAFLLGETAYPGGGTPADLLIPKSIVNAPFSPAGEWLTMRLEARPHHYTLLIDGKRVLDVDDARYAQGTEVGVWADNAPVRVRDFRLYTLAN
jgi:hypothetical protein